MTPLRRLTFVCAALALTALAFLSLRPSTFVDQVPWMPHWLGAWADHHGVFRNTVAFFAVGLFLFSALGRHWTHVLALAIFATSIEVAQRWIPSRVYDPQDIAASLAGIALAWLVVLVVRAVVVRRRA